MSASILLLWLGWFRQLGYGVRSKCQPDKVQPFHAEMREKVHSVSSVNEELYIAEWLTS